MNQLTERLRAVPGTEGVGVTFGRPLDRMPISPSELFELMRDDSAEKTATAARREGTGAMA